MLVYLGYLYLGFGAVFLFLPLVYIRIGRPRDLIKAGLYLTIGLILIIKNNFFNHTSSLLIICLTILISFHVLEIFSFRWNLLTVQEKHESKTFEEFKKNVAILLKSISLIFIKLSETSDIFKFNKSNENTIKKKWVRDEKNDSILSSQQNELITLEMKKKATNQPKKDIIKEKKN